MAHHRFKVRDSVIDDRNINTKIANGRKWHIVTSKKETGFTLIELLVVISIISLLSVIVLASLQSARDKAKNTAKNEIALQYINALELYASSYDGTYPDSDTVNPTYFNCLGFSTGVKCHVLYEGLDALNNALAPYYSGTPKADDFSIVIAGTEYKGILYKKISASEYKLQWYLKDTSNCVRGAKETPTAGKTLCTYPEE